MAEDNSGAGFTVKEMLVRLETKMDVILSDHEARIRRIEASDALAEGSSNTSDRLSARFVAYMALIATLMGNVGTIIWLTH